MGNGVMQESFPMAWLLLILAGLCEIGWAIGLKYTEGFSRLWPAVWVGVGAVGTAIFGIVLFGESASPGRLLSLALIVAGIVGLKLAT
jgi:quaternary ammonium compound-resistance protein SugE